MLEDYLMGFMRVTVDKGESCPRGEKGGGLGREEPGGIEDGRGGSGKNGSVCVCREH